MILKYQTVQGIIENLLKEPVSSPKQEIQTPAPKIEDFPSLG